MRRAAFLGIVSLWMVACVSRPAAVEHRGRIVELTDSSLRYGGRDTVRLGKLRSSEIAVSRLWIANRASRPVTVASSDRSCGCVDFVFDAAPLLPGETREFGLSFDSRGLRGWQFKTLDLFFAGTSRPLRFFVDVEVE